MTALAIYQMCKEAKKHFTVALSGLGGDEIFYGYNKYETFYRLRKIYKYSSIIHQSASFLKKMSILTDKLQLAEDLTRGTKTEQYLQVKSSSNHKVLKELYEQMPTNLIPEDKKDIVHNVRNFDIRFSMPQSFIPAVDRGAMRASLEVRTPFLSRELVEYTSTIDQRSLIAFGKKYVLRKILKNYMPLNILYRGKQGFTFSPKSYYLDSSPPIPKLPFINQAKLETFWSKKIQDQHETISMRLSILDSLYATK
jgi:asparagine synthase (glutamine-hydrolysing)